jgi:uncharacterized membrane protein YeaQ/YmgE (transglycosylase-associated protein family)
MDVVITIFVWLLCGIACSVIAASKNRSEPGWFFGGLALGLIGVIIVACLPPITEQKCHCGDGCACNKKSNGEQV